MLALRRLRPCFRWNVILFFALAVVAQAAAQSSPPPSTLTLPPQTSGPDKSVAAAVRDAKGQKTSHAKKIITDDDLDATTTALPRLRMEGADNGDDIVTAITQFKQSHTPAQTEAAVRAWYERYDEMLAAAIQENLDLKTLSEANLSNGYELCQQSGDYEKCESRRQTELNGARHDQATVARNASLEVRIQHAFMKIRGKLMQQNLRYDWFKIRTTNGIDIY